MTEIREKGPPIIPKVTTGAKHLVAAFLFPSGELCEGDVMRIPAAIMVAALGVAPALAQQNATSPATTTTAPVPVTAAVTVDPCSPVKSQLASDLAGTVSRLFLNTPTGYKEVSRDAPFHFLSDYVLKDYHDQSLQFLFAPARRNAERKQYLAVRTRSSSFTENARVALWKNKKQYAGDVGYGTYQTYHLNPSSDDRVLRHYHKWGRDRSDEPVTTRAAFAFGFSDWFKKLLGKKELEERRLLTIPFSTSADHQTCFKFALRPRPAAIEADEEDVDQISLTKSFTIDIAEVRAFHGGPGETFVVRYEKK